MSTPNFRKIHARNYYVVSNTTTRWDDEEGKDVECHKDSDDYDWDIECAVDRGKEKGYEPVENKDYYVCSMGDIRPIMYKTDYYAFGGKKNADIKAFNDFKVEREIFARSGYYSGMNYDWDLNITCNFEEYRLSEYNSVEDLIKDMSDAWYEEAEDSAWGWGAGMATIQRKNLEKWLERLIDKCSDEADDMCQDICDEELVCTCVMGNGEALYHRANSLKGICCNVEAA